MSVNEGSSAVVSIGPQGIGGPAFTQQGSLDWVAVGRSLVEVPVAILGRLSSAGVDVLTVVVGRAICSKIPLGIHGEKVLSEAMGQLGWCSSFGDAIWFGVGVEHILRILVKTSEGASLVALCAALAEGHNLDTATLIMFELAKRSGSPSELSPSFAQWQAMVKVCSSAFCHTTLGLRIETMLRLGGYTEDEVSSRAAGHPQDMAEIICALGDVAAGRLLDISIRGGPACSWIAVYADFVLGLRVVVTKEDGCVLSSSFNMSTQKAQVNITFYKAKSPGNEGPSHDIAVVGRTFTLRSGASFIANHVASRVHEADRVYEDGRDSRKERLLGGRLDWNTLLHETFGEDFEDLLENPPSSAGSNLAKPEQYLGATRSKEVVDLNDAFVRFFLAGAAFYTYATTESTRYMDIQDFLSSATTHLTELLPLKTKLLQTAGQRNLGRSTTDDICKEYLLARKELMARCFCPYHRSFNRLREHWKERRYCLVGVAKTSLIMVYLLGRLHLETPLYPRRHGILRIFDDVKRGIHRALDRDIVKSDLVRDGEHEGLNLFSTYIALFSGEPFSLSVVESASAISDGKIYCYIDTVRELTDSYQQASIVHIGAGAIQVGYRLHYSVFDGSDLTRSYSARYTAISDRVPVQSGFAQDTTSPGLQVTCAVHDSQHLAYWYRLSPQQSSQHDEISMSIGPGSFLTRLAHATWILIRLRLDYAKTDLNLGDGLDDDGESGDLSDMDLVGSDSDEDALNDHSFEMISAHGEGFLPLRSPGNTAIIFRPHYGNKLGRCAALGSSEPPMALVNVMRDLENFVSVYQEPGALDKRRCLTLIS